MASEKQRPDGAPRDPIVEQARRNREHREQGYREQALKLFPHLCGRCRREFEGKNLRMLTVHHRDHDHDNNPPDGSNWELLCRYCHDNEHSRLLDATGYDGAPQPGGAAEPLYKPFANLKDLLKPKGE
jgi:5-methylcytosine-specific restriction endonuclease McrA